MTNIKNTIFFLLLFLLSACSQNNSTSSPPPPEAMVDVVNNVDVPTLKTLMNMGNKVLLDVRTPEEVANGAIEGAIHINFYDSDFDTQINSLDKTKDYIVYCKSGARSAKAAKKMQSAGFPRVYNLEGGYIAWSK